MRKLRPWLLVFCLMPVIISTCKKDRIIEPQIFEEKWLFDKVVYEEFDTADSLLNSETFSDWTTNDYLALSSDGDFDLLQNGRRLIGIYAIENSVLSLTYNQTNNQNQIVAVTTKAAVLEKSTSKFTFFVEGITATGKDRATYYLLK